jgi:hypothetical protein
VNEDDRLIPRSLFITEDKTYHNWCKDNPEKCPHHKNDKDAATEGEDNRPKMKKTLSSLGWGVPYVTEAAFSEGPKIGLLLCHLRR